MPPPLVSIIVPCYNYGRFLPSCVDSILSMRGADEIEVLLIDDKSTDDTADVMRAYESPRVKLLFNERNLGHVSTVTRGLQSVTGRYVARIDPDDRYRPNFLDVTVPCLEDDPHVGLAYGDVALIDADGVVTQEPVDTQHGGRDFRGNELVALMRRNFICAPSVLARREAWLAALPVPANLAFNDWWFTLMIARTWAFHYVNRVVAEYRVHGENHHIKVAREGTEETSVLRVLDRLYSEPEADPRLDAEKQAARDSIYATQFVDFANKYFGFGLNVDARRCYLRAIRHRPALLGNAEIVRRLIATALARRLYDSVKQSVKRVPHA